jgi:ABC-type phosphate transport system permease subunit
METNFGIGIILFGVLIGGVGVATAGVGNGIPMIPLGIYLIWRGIYRKKINKDLLNPEPYKVEKTPLGKILFGILISTFGLAFSAIIIGIPILLYGIFLIYSGTKLFIKKNENKN